MDLMYGNDGMNYRTLAKSSGVSSEIEKNLLSGYRSYYFVNDRQKYSNSSKEPESVFYVSSNLNSSLDSDMVVLCKNGRMSQYATPSFYFHAHLIAPDEAYYKEKFFEIFQMEFVKDTDVDKYDNLSVESYEIGRGMNLTGEGLTENQLKSILYTFYGNLRLNRQVKILVDKSGDDYNRRSREILNIVYRYLPYDFRKRHGFLTYCDEQQTTGSRITFVLYDAELVQNITDAYLDLRTCDAEACRRNVKKEEICEYVDSLVSMSEEERAEQFDMLEATCQGSRLDLQACLSYFSNVKKWSTGSPEELMPQWVEYVSRNGQKGGVLFDNLVSIINSKIDSTYYNNYLFEKLEQVKQLATDLFNLPMDIRKVILFSEYIGEGMEIDLDLFVPWYTESVSEYTKADFQAENWEQYIQKLSECIEGLKQFNIGAKQIEKSIEEDILPILEDDKNAAEQKIRDEIKKENEKLEQVINQRPAELSLQYAGYLASIHAGEWRYEENKNYFAEKLQNIVDSLFSQKQVEGVWEDEEIDGAEKLLTTFLDYLAPEKLGEYGEQLKKAKQENAKRFEDNIVPFETRSDLLQVLYKEAQFRQLVEKYHYKNPVELKLQIDSMYIHLSLEHTQQFVEFFIQPNRENLKVFHEVIKKTKREILYNLLAKEFFEESAISFLCYYAEKSSEEDLVEKVYEYFEDRHETNTRRLEKEHQKLTMKDKEPSEKPEKSDGFRAIRENLQTEFKQESKKMKSSPLDDNLEGDQEEKKQKWSFPSFGSKKNKK